MISSNPFVYASTILRSSFIPQGKYMELRQLVRERLDLIGMGSTYVNKMQKALELMNIKLPEVISQVHGSSGMKMLRAIIAGKREPGYLLSLCDARIIKHKHEQVIKALEGNYKDTYLFMLKQNMELWDVHQSYIDNIDAAIDALLAELSRHKPAVATGRAKAVRHHAPKIKGLNDKMARLYGADLCSISGINDYTLLRLIGETGTDMSRFSTVKHFVSWAGLRLSNTKRKDK